MDYSQIMNRDSLIKNVEKAVGCLADNIAAEREMLTQAQTASAQDGLNESLSSLDEAMRYLLRALDDTNAL